MFICLAQMVSNNSLLSIKTKKNISVMKIGSDQTDRRRTPSRGRRSRSRSRDVKVCSSQDKRVRYRSDSRGKADYRRNRSKDRSFSRSRDRSQSRDRRRSVSRGKDDKWQFAERCFEVIKTYSRVERDEIKADKSFEQYRIYQKQSLPIR